MKKENAFVFMLCLMFATSVSFGVKTKEKNEKNQIKKELNNVLIPNAEKKLDSLILTCNMLRDSITCFQNELQNQTQYTQIKKQIPTTQEISNTLKTLADQWHCEYTKTQNQISEHSDSTTISPKTKQKITYLTNNIVSTPVLESQRFDYISENLQNSLEDYISMFYSHNPKDIQSEYEIVDGFYVTLHNVKDFISAIDNSQNVLNKYKLRQLQQNTDSAVTAFGKMQQEDQTQIIIDKLNKLKQNKDSTDNRLNNHVKELAKLKSSFAVDNIYKARHKEK